MNKIGIFIGYAPEQPIKNQGIGRLMIFIINGIMGLKNTEICIATPFWYKEILIDFLQEQHVDLSKIEILTTDKLPYLLRIRNLITRTLKRKSARKAAQINSESNTKNRLFSKIKRISRIGLKVVFKWLAVSSTPLFILYGFLLISAAILLSPVILLLCLGFVLSEFYKAPQRFFPNIKNNFLVRKLAHIKHTFSRYLTFSLSTLKNNAIAHMAYAEMRKTEFRKIINIINRNNNVPVWFVPSLFWPEVKDIKAKKVIAAPDIVFVDFPSLFQDLSFVLSHEIITKTLTVADHFICYSDYVKQKHLVEPFGVEPQKISVIEHGVIQLNEEFNQIRLSNTSMRNLALDTMREYQTATFPHDAYLNKFDFENINFIFYSSQIRPHKNFLNMIKAYEILLRRKFINIKLIVTANIYDNVEVTNYIRERKLSRDIIALTHVSSKVLAALNHLATCAVNPSLFEGGFPFTFNEAYSVGTPSIMSKIPVVTRHVPDKELQAIMLFDPYDIDDMVNKIEWGIKNREQLIQLQKPLYQEFEKRTWDIVAGDYINLLNQIATAPA